MFGAWACSDCHDMVDSRTGGGCFHDGNKWVDRQGVLEFFYEGVFRTLKILLDEERIGVL